MALQSIAQRAESAHHLRRLDALWPEPPVSREPPPEEVIDRWLGGRTGPAWLVDGGPHWPLQRGRGPRPPLGLLTRLRVEGFLPPMEAEGFVWRGFPLRGQGATVGACLLGEAPDAPPDAEAAAAMLAPWLGRLNPPLEAPGSSHRDAPT